MEFKLIPNLPEGIVDIQWGPDDWLMYLRLDQENNSYIGLIKLGVIPQVHELKNIHNPLTFAIHQPTGRYAVIDDRGLLIGNLNPGTGVDRRVRLPNLAKHPHTKIIWSGQGNTLACRTTALDSIYLSGMMHAVTVIEIDGLETWSRFSTTELTNFSLSGSGNLLSTEGHAGKPQVDFYVPFGRWSKSLGPASAHSFSSDGSRSAWLEHRRGFAELHVSAGFDNSKAIATYPSNEGNDKPSELVWSGTSRYLFANPKIDWHQRWLMYDLVVKQWRQIFDGELSPLTTHRISTSPDDTQAVILTLDGPAIVTF